MERVTYVRYVFRLPGATVSQRRPQVVVPCRQTFYGMDEIFMREPCGTLVRFTSKVEQEAG